MSLKPAISAAQAWASARSPRRLAIPVINAGSLAAAALAAGLEIEEISSPDDNLQSVFEYLVGK